MTASTDTATSSIQPPARHSAGEQMDFFVTMGPAAPLLSTCAEVFSRWFMAMRSCVLRNRGVRQCPDEEQRSNSLSEAESAVSEYSESLIRSMFGDFLADYAKDKFLHAVQTGDMRAFKIRLLFIKARDSLSAFPSTQRDFSREMEKYIEDAENRAGCKPDHTPRRLSRKEREIRHVKELERAKRDSQQQKLQLAWNDTNDICDKYVTDVETVSTDDVCNNLQSKQYIDVGNKAQAHEEEQYVERDIDTHRKETCEKKIKSTSEGEVKSKPGITVTGGRKKSKSSNWSITRKAREYETVEQILDDIESGAIVPYDSSDEICEDLKSGKITPVEAFMFTAALERYCHEDEEDSSMMELEREYVKQSDRYEDLEEDECLDGEDEDGYGAEGDDLDWRDSGNGFSYNPNGFGGLEGFENEDGDW